MRTWRAVQAAWRAAMRGEVPVVQSEAALDLFADIPADADRVIAIYPTGERARGDSREYAIRWIGVTPEQVAAALYQMADAVVEQRIPKKDYFNP